MPMISDQGLNAAFQSEEFGYKEFFVGHFNFYSTKRVIRKLSFDGGLRSLKVTCLSERKKKEREKEGQETKNLYQIKMITSSSSGKRVTISVS